jgi:hypothetical protein
LLKTIDDESFGRASALTLLLDGIWEKLDRATQNKCITFIKEGRAKDVVAVLAYSIKHPSLADFSKARIAMLDQPSLKSLLQREVVPDAVARAIDLFCKATNWRSANSIADDLIVPVVPNLSLEQIKRIVRSPVDGSNDLLGSAGYSKFLEEVISQGKMTREQLAAMLSEAGLTKRADRLLAQEEEEEDIPF